MTEEKIPPAEGAPDGGPKPELVKLKVDRKEIELPMEEVIRRAQLGSKRERWEQELQAKEEVIKADSQAFQSFVGWRDWLVANPEKAARIRAITSGRQDARDKPIENLNYNREPNLERGESHVQADPNPDPPPAVQAALNRLTQLEANLTRRLASLDRNTQETAIATALSEQSALRGNEEALSLARDIVEVGMQRNPGADAHELAAEASAKIVKMFGDSLQQKLDERSRNMELSTLKPGDGTPSISEEQVKFEAGSGLEELRSGTAKRKVADWLASQGRALTNPPGKR